jgi:hypothetical protein
MSKYELLNYDELQRRIGIDPDLSVWHCGANPGDEATFDDGGGTFDDGMTYTGWNPSIAGGLCLTNDINVNGLLLNHRDLNGTIWICTGIDGWWTTPPAEISDVPKPFWDGSLLTTGRYTVRTITITGCFIPPDKSLVWYNRRALIQVSTLVRGIGLLAMCGNETDVLNNELTPSDPFLDPPKMAIIQSADTPLIDTTRGNGFTQFSLSFRCVYATKISVYEKHTDLPIEDTSGPDAVTRQRYYRSFDMTAAEETAAHPSGGGTTTQYNEVRNTVGTEHPDRTRRYSEVEKLNLDSLIKDEEWQESSWASLSPAQRALYYLETGVARTTVLHNAGNYFAFPIFVFDDMTGVSTTSPVVVRNITTSESMTIQKPVPVGQQLVVDTGTRRVGVVEDHDAPPTWKWDDRNYLSLTSAWISLAPGDNTIVLSKPVEVHVTTLPRVYFRDTWIG